MDYTSCTQLSLLTLAMWISLKRLTDYYHHSSDVLAGIIVAVVFALITLSQLRTTNLSQRIVILAIFKSEDQQKF